MKVENEAVANGSKKTLTIISRSDVEKFPESVRLDDLSAPPAVIYSALTVEVVAVCLHR